jgi:Holliday junction DNA helicase RuvA
MLYSLSGKLIVKKSQFVVIEANGIGFRVFVSAKTHKNLPKVGSKARVFCHLNISQNGSEIYGFSDEKELELFNLLTSVNGIGPKSAITILGNLKVDKFLSIIVHGKPELISDAWGIGRKKAERIVLELKDKIKKSGLVGDVSEFESDKDVKSALKNLGYKQKEVQEALDNLPTGVKKAEDRLKHVLKFLSQR